MSVFGRRIKGMIRLGLSMSGRTTWHVTTVRSSRLRYVHDASGSRNKLETHGATLAGYCYAMRHEMEVQIVTPYRASHIVTALRYAVTFQECTHLKERTPDIHRLGEWGTDDLVCSLWRRKNCRSLSGRRITMRLWSCASYNRYPNCTITSINSNTNLWSESSGWRGQKQLSKRLDIFSHTVSPRMLDLW
jgi:hypothetical protein